MDKCDTCIYEKYMNVNCVNCNSGFNNYTPKPNAVTTNSTEIDIDLVKQFLIENNAKFIKQHLYGNTQEEKDYGLKMHNVIMYLKSKI